MSNERKPGDQDPDFGESGVISVGLNQSTGGHIKRLSDGYLIIGTYVAGATARSLAQPATSVITHATPKGLNYRAGEKVGVVTVRLDTNGKLVESYGTGGYAFLELFEHRVRVTGSLVVPNEGVLLTLGLYDLAGGESDSLIVIKVGDNGEMDTSFGINGIHRPALTYPNSIAGGMALQENGKILITAETIKTFNDVYSAVMRIDKDGVTDLSFGDGGFVYSTAKAQESYSRIRLDSQQRIYVTGNLGDKMAISRFFDNGSVDKSFAEGGKFTYGDGSAGGFVANLAIRGDGIFVVGALGAIGEQTAVYTKLSLDGKPDQSFNGGEPLSIPLGEGNIGSYVIPLESGLSIGIGTTFGDTSALTLSRINADGTLDTTFGEQGSVLTKVPGYLFTSFAEEIKDDEGAESKLLIGGWVVNPRPGENTSFWISRYLT